ncbi:phenylalanine--tRNA ligase subunit beta [Fervidibacillus halotolerans]|uniref:Phenylalanine--tRNA ligase beta subunit n=1 Tax=Fervidibacillus halotolerans TaxID=2980027 RepID=A0A9E8LY95_9BACI|nr:phenylalanine--tRNA ligase subunit beta [Fervidibacillus halotolerans]WAA11632.1 phenylalanine--tRNA ligase subunit beta [Fervidibacillus halotolerans]
MLVSYKWLQSYIDLDGITPSDLAEKLTKAGIEVDGIEMPGEGLKNLIVGHVLKSEKHPNADKLNRCLVDLGEEEPVQIICGAPNVAAGQKVIVAKPGARLPGNIKIKRSKIRGEVSNGMICSLQEIGFTTKVVPKDYADGIYVLPEESEVGTEIVPLFNMDDAILDLDLTANRADCMSMIGVAYEVGAILNRQVKLPEIKGRTSAERASDYIHLKVETPQDNPLYTAKIIKNVKIGPSPLWLQTRLMASGIRPHNNVVDVTNYILLEYGQPLHAFDYDRFGSKEVVVRRAKRDEKLTTLDDVERTLTEDHLVITNGIKPVALAGVMGGADSEVQTDTKTVLLESAYFNGTVVRKASRDHGLRSESSSRFEKGIDPNRVREAAERAAELIAELAGGEVLEGMVEADSLTIEPVKIDFELGKLNKRIGTNLFVDDVEKIIKRLQFSYQVNGESFTVTVPSRRWDIRLPEDMYEEIARLYGYDHIPKTLPMDVSFGGLTPYQKKRRIVRTCLEGLGLMQSITYSLTSEEKYSQFAMEKADPIELANPMSEAHSVLRLSLVPHLLDAVSYNLARKNKTVFLYEIGSVFYSKGKNCQPEEREHLAGAMTGLYVDHPWQGKKEPVDFYTVKGILDVLFEKLSVSRFITYEKGQLDGLHPGQTANILLDGKVIGFVGKINPDMEKWYDVKDVFVFELHLGELLMKETDELLYTSIPKFPSISRDIALIVDREISAGDLQRTIQDAGKDLLKEVKVFDVYEGENVPAGKKSIAFTLTYYDPERTLTDEEVVVEHEKILTAVKDAHGAELRK